MKFINEKFSNTVEGIDAVSNDLADVKKEKEKEKEKWRDDVRHIGFAVTNFRHCRWDIGQSCKIQVDGASLDMRNSSLIENSSYVFLFLHSQIYLPESSLSWSLFFNYWLSFVQRFLLRASITVRVDWTTTLVYSLNISGLEWEWEYLWKENKHVL